MFVLASCASMRTETEATGNGKLISTAGDLSLSVSLKTASISASTTSQPTKQESTQYAHLMRFFNIPMTKKS